MKAILAAAVCGVALAAAMPLAGQAPRVFPEIDVRVPSSPRPFIAAGSTHLVYELHVTNLTSRPTTIDAIEGEGRI